MYFRFRGERCDRKWIRIEVRSDKPNSAVFTTKDKKDLCWMPILKLTAESPNVTEVTDTLSQTVRKSMLLDVRWYPASTLCLI